MSLINSPRSHSASTPNLAEMERKENALSRSMETIRSGIPRITLSAAMNSTASDDHIPSSASSSSSLSICNNGTPPISSSAPGSLQSSPRKGSSPAMPIPLSATKEVVDRPR